jgi:LacI family transcriptional regulator
MNKVKQLERGERVTIRTVAADAGVSVAAVSKVLRNAYGVSDSLRQKVIASIERLKYQPSIAARAMRGQTYTVGILLINIENPFLPQIISGVNERLASSSYKAMIGIGQANLPIESSFIESMIANNMDGLILVAPKAPGDMISRYARKLPIVAVAHHHEAATLYDTVNGDDELGARVAVNALLAEGHRDVLMLSQEERDFPETGVTIPRELGYTNAMTAAGLAERIRIIRIPDAGPERDESIKDVLSSADRPRAIFCWSDLHGIHVINQAKTMGIGVPDDLAIVAYDNSAVASLPLIDLASIDQAGRKLGIEAAELLLSRIGGRTEARHLLMEPHLVRRSSI